MGIVKRFNPKNGYGFINNSDTHEDIYVYETATAWNNPQKIKSGVGEGQIVELYVVVIKKGREAAKVTGPNS